MTKPNIQIDDEIREMTDKEFADYQIHAQALENRKAKDLEKAQDKAAILERLGITADEAALLLS